MNESTKLAGVGIAGVVAGGLMMMGAVVSGETVNVRDDGVSAVEVQKVIITNRTTQDTITFDGTLNDIASELKSLDQQIAELQAKRTQLLSLRTKIQTELNKLPARTKGAVAEPL